MQKKSVTKINESLLMKESYVTSTTEVTFERLVRLWKSLKGTVIPKTEIQIACDENEEYEAYDISVDRAKIDFAVAVKKFNQLNPDRDFLDAQRRKGAVTITPVQVESKDKTYPVKNGYVEEYTMREVMIRQVSDILVAYTQFSTTHKCIVPTMNELDCIKNRIPYLNLVDCRNALEVDDTDVIEARNKIYYKLKNNEELPFLFFYIMQRITRQQSMEKFRVPASTGLVDWYVTATAFHTKYRFDTYYLVAVPKLSSYRMDFVSAWKFALASDGIRGGQKKKGLISACYYTYPLAPTMVRVIAEAKDIISVLTVLKIYAIDMIVPNAPLAEILVYNGISVRCPALSVRNQLSVKDKVLEPGVYHSIIGPCVIYRAARSKPNRDGSGVKFEQEIPYSASELRSCYLTATLPYASYYPSCRVADGIVMGYYEPLTHKDPSDSDLGNINKRINLLLDRFVYGIVWRNHFVFSRLGFYSRDNFRECFLPIRIGPIRKEEADPFVVDQTESFDILPLTFKKEQFVKCEKMASIVVVREPVPTPEMIELLMQYAGLEEDSYSKCHLHRILDFLVNDKKKKSKIYPNIRYVIKQSPRMIRLILKQLDNELVTRSVGDSEDDILFDYYPWCAAQQVEPVIPQLRDGEVIESSDSGSATEGETVTTSVVPSIDQVDDSLFGNPISYEETGAGGNSSI